MCMQAYLSLHGLLQGAPLKITKCFKTSLLCRLQAQTLPDEAPPIGKIHRFSKITVTFEPLMGF